MSPFGAASAPPASPFAAAKAPATQQRNAPLPLAAPEPFKPTLAQVIIFVSFTTITALMLSTFYVVIQAGGIHFNDS